MGRRVMTMREEMFKAYMEVLSEGRAESVMGDANIQVLKDVLQQSWSAQSEADKHDRIDTVDNA